jgi:hypothetical protein
MRRTSFFYCLFLLFVVPCAELPAQGFINLRLERQPSSDPLAWSTVNGGFVFGYWQHTDDVEDELDAIAWVQDSASGPGGSAHGECKHRAMCLTPVGAWDLAPEILAETYIDQSMSWDGAGAGISAAGAAYVDETFTVQENPNYPGVVDNAELRVLFTIVASAGENETGADISWGNGGQTFWAASAGRSSLTGVYVGGGAWHITGSIANGANDVPVDETAAGLVIEAWEPINVNDSVHATAQSNAQFIISGSPGSANHSYFAEPTVTLTVRVPN